MPKKRGRYKRYKAYTHDALDTANKALKVAHGIQKLMNVEKKFDDLDASGTTGTTEVVSSMFTIPQGDGVNTRDGYSLKPISLQVLLKLSANATAAAGSQMVHFFIGQMVNDTSPGAVTWYNSGTNAMQLKNLDSAAYARIIYSHRFALDSQKSVLKELFFDSKKLRKIQYDDTDTAGTAYRNGQLFWGIISNDNTNAPSYSLSARLRYVDN